MSLKTSPNRELAPQQLLERKIRVALQVIDRGQSSAADHLEQALMAVEALPLTSGEFASAKAKLINAQRYLDDDEPGAARYELNSLLRRLPRLLPQVAQRPARRWTATRWLAS